MIDLLMVFGLFILSCPTVPFFLHVIDGNGDLFPLYIFIPYASFLFFLYCASRQGWRSDYLITSGISLIIAIILFIIYKTKR